MGARVGRRDHAAEQQIGMAAQVLGGRVHDQIGAQLKRLLDQRGGERAVDHDQRVRLVPCGADGGQVSNRQQWVRWRFEPQQVGVGGELEPARGVLDGDADDAPPALRGTRGGQTCDSLVAVVAEPHGGTDREQVKDGCDRAQPEANANSPTALEATQHLLKRLPSRGRVIATVGPLGTELEVRRQDRRNVQRRPSARRRPGRPSRPTSPALPASYAPSKAL